MTEGNCYPGLNSLISTTMESPPGPCLSSLSTISILVYLFLFLFPQKYLQLIQESETSSASGKILDNSCYKLHLVTSLKRTRNTVVQPEDKVCLSSKYIHLCFKLAHWFLGPVPGNHWRILMPLTSSTISIVAWFWVRKGVLSPANTVSSYFFASLCCFCTQSCDRSVGWTILPVWSLVPPSVSVLVLINLKGQCKPLCFKSC